MTIKKIVAESGLELHEAELLLSHLLRRDQIYLRTHTETEISKAVGKKFHTLCKRRKQHEPIAYILNTQPFLGLDLYVNKNVLIPRPETEELAAWIIKYLKEKTDPSVKTLICDIGTGSGCLAVAIASHLPNMNVFATDTSPKALIVARKNIRSFAKQVKSYKGSLFDKFIQRQLESIIEKKEISGIHILANLPYLPKKDQKSLSADVAKYEPPKALFGGANGSELILKLITQVSIWHDKKTPKIPLKIWLEIDPRNADNITGLYRSKNLELKKIEIKKDHCGWNRYVIIEC